MSYPKRAKGWRQITIDGRLFRWHFDGEVVDRTAPHPRETTAVLKLQGSASSGRQVRVTLSHWYSPWDFIGQLHRLNNEPPVVTARFAEQAIRFALDHGWEPDVAGEPLNMMYEDKAFSCANSANLS